MSFSTNLPIRCFRAKCHGISGDVDTLKNTALFNNTFDLIIAIIGAIDLLIFVYQNRDFTAVSMESHRRSDAFRNRDLTSVTSNGFGIIQHQMYQRPFDINTSSHMSSASQLLII